jgi:hypothetical protein
MDSSIEWLLPPEAGEWGILVEGESECDDWLAAKPPKGVPEFIPLLWTTGETAERLLTRA